MLLYKGEFVRVLRTYVSTIYISPEKTEVPLLHILVLEGNNVVAISSKKWSEIHSFVVD